jgi:type II secretory pathway component PulF
MGEFLSPRMSLVERARLCRRLATTLTAGIDIRKVLAREAEQARTATARRRLSEVSSAVAQGESLSAALATTGDFFPPLFHELVEVGEQTGHQGEIFAKLAEHYENQMQLRRTFLATITWPLIELGIALAAVGLLIWIAGILGKTAGPQRLDFLGFGLVGDRGLTIYLAFLATVTVVLFVMIRAASRGLMWVRPIQRAVQCLPGLGTALQTMALARLAWSMQLTMHAGMEVRRALRLSLRSTRSVKFTDKIDAIDATIADGNSIFEAFDAAGGFPFEFLETVHVGEESGKLVDSMAHLSRQYREEAQRALTTLTRFSGIAVWGLVAILIIVLIFRLAFFYIGILKSFI